MGDRRSKTHTCCGSLLIGVSLASAVLAADFSGSVAGVIPADTIEVLHYQHPTRIRLSVIDCPEKGQIPSLLRPRPPDKSMIALLF